MRFDTEIELRYSRGYRDAFNRPTKPDEIIIIPGRFKSVDSSVSNKASGEDSHIIAKVTLPYPVLQPSRVSIRGVVFKVKRSPIHKLITTLYLMEEDV